MTGELEGVKDMFRDVVTKFVEVEQILKAGEERHEVGRILKAVRASLGESLKSLREISGTQADVCRFFDGELPVDSIDCAGHGVITDRSVSDEVFVREIATIVRNHNDFDRLAILGKLVRDIREVLSAYEKRSGKLAEQIGRYGKEDANERRNALMLKERTDASARIMRNRLNVLAEKYFMLRKRAVKRVLDSSRLVQGAFAEGDAITRQSSYRHDVSGLLEEIAILDGKFRYRARARK